jgi:hypothetical protein
MPEDSPEREFDHLDDASLVASLVEQCIRPVYKRAGGPALNRRQRLLLALFDFDNEVFNGGFEQWLLHVPGELVTMTPRCLSEIGADEMAALVDVALKAFRGEGPDVAEEQCHEQLLNLPKERRELIAGCDRRFGELEGAMITQLYSFARSHLTELITVPNK